MLEIVVAALVIMVTSLVGVIFTWKVLGRYIKKNMGLLVSFSAGVFLVLIGVISGEVFEHSNTIAQALLWISFGSVGVLVLFNLLPNFHHHHGSENEDHVHSSLDVRKIIISDSIHNVGDGVLLAVAFAVSVPVGITATVSVFVHEVIQEISEFFVLKEAGLSTKKALAINFLCSSTILIGVIGGCFLLETFDAIEVPLLGFSAGAFLVVVTLDLLPDSIRHSRMRKNYLQHGILFLIGVSLMLGANTLFGHSHKHQKGEEKNHGHEKGKESMGDSEDYHDKNEEEQGEEYDHSSN